MRIALLLTILFAGAGVSFASVLTVGTNANDTVCIGSATPPFCAVFFLSQPQNASGIANVSGTFGPSTANETVSASAQAGYGILDASSTSSFSVTGTPEADFITANANFEDIVTISDPSLNGQAGLLSLSYFLDGTVSGSAFAVVITQAGTSLGQQWAQQYSSSVDGTFSLPSPIQFIYGQPFGLSIQLSTSAGTPTGYGVLNAETGSGSGTADFFSTFVLTGLDPEDSNGNPVSGVTFSSQSGTVYSTNGIVPEPSMLGLALLALLMIGMFVRRRQQLLA